MERSQKERLLIFAALSLGIPAVAAAYLWLLVRGPVWGLCLLIFVGVVWLCWSWSGDIASSRARRRKSQH